VLGPRRGLRHGLDGERQVAAGRGCGDHRPLGLRERRLGAGRVHVDRGVGRGQPQVEQVVARRGPLRLQRREVDRGDRGVERVLDARRPGGIGADAGAGEAVGRVGRRRRADHQPAGEIDHEVCGRDAGGAGRAHRRLAAAARDRDDVIADDAERAVEAQRALVGDVDRRAALDERRDRVRLRDAPREVDGQPRVGRHQRQRFVAVERAVGSSARDHARQDREHPR
jgi:hypothetical protein